MTSTNTRTPRVTKGVLSTGRQGLSFGNQFWSLDIELEGAINPIRLVHLASNTALADTDYCYRIELASAEGGSGYCGGPQSARAVRLID